MCLLRSNPFKDPHHYVLCNLYWRQKEVGQIMAMPVNENEKNLSFKNEDEPLMVVSSNNSLKGLRQLVRRNGYQ